MRPSPPPTLFGRDVQRIHCLGAGGMGVGPLAIYLAGLGFEVSGEDDALGAEMAAQLAAAGVRVGPMAAGCELVARSSAVGPPHAGWLLAERAGVPIVRRGEVLAEAVRGKRLVAVCGSHGKTTTTAMIVTALRAGHFPGGYVLGGLLADGSPPARVGSNDWVVAEVDESDGTIGAFAPEITVAVNLDWDHPDRYRAPEELERAFAGLFARTTGTVLLSDVCSRSLKLKTSGSICGPAVATFGKTGDFAARMVIEEGERMTLQLAGRFVAPCGRSSEKRDGGVASTVPRDSAGERVGVRARGEFNAANATAALAAVVLMVAPVGPKSLLEYPGVRRRQTLLSTEGGLLVVDDYAHHPAEIRALLESLRKRVCAAGRLWVVFQPHRFTRTAQFCAEFAAALCLPDFVHLLDVYPAGEAPLPGGTTADIYAELRRLRGAEAVSYLPGVEGLEGFNGNTLRSGDVLAFVGAGDIDVHARQWLAQRAAHAAAAAQWDRQAASLRKLVSADTRIRREEPLAKRTTLRVGGAARLYAEPASENDLFQLLKAATAASLPVYPLGRGSNLIIPDEGVDGLVIALAQESWSRFEPNPDGSVRVGAGLRLKNLCGLAAAAGLSGFEFLEGIPGSVGGSLRMNAGAMGGWIFDLVQSVDLMWLDGTRATLGRADMHVDYRHCAELHRAIALGAVLRPPGGAGSDSISGQIDTYRRRRHESQPREPSAGCIFKNPPGSSAGRLIDEAGLKGSRVGGAEVSPVHANFIINRGNATSADVLELIRQVRARVRAARGVDLEPEVLLYGRNWKEIL